MAEKVKVLQSKRVSSFLYDGIKVDLVFDKKDKLWKGNVAEFGFDNKKKNQSGKTQLDCFLEYCEKWQRVEVF